MFKMFILALSFFFLNAASCQDGIQCVRNPFYRCQLNDSSCTALNESWKCFQAEVHAACVGTYSEDVESKLFQAEKKTAIRFGERDIVHECIYKWYYDGLAQNDTMDGFCKFYKPLSNECDLKNRGPCNYMINMIKQSSKVLANVSCQNLTPAEAEICMAETENCSAEVKVSTAENCSAEVIVSTAKAEISTVAAENSTTMADNSRLLTTLIYYLLFISTLFTLFSFINLY